MYYEIELAKFEPDLVHVDARNRITHRSRSIPTQAAA
jgi:aspartate 1-decarboxylase